MIARKPTYRRLTQDELATLEQEFIEYLIVNGIQADGWEKLKTEDKGKAEDIITLFSDVIFEGIMRKVRFLDHYSPDEVRSIQCLSEKMVLVGMKSNDPSHDFTDESFIEEAGKKAPGGLEVFSAEKFYAKKRELELYDMICNGATISRDGKLFKALSLSLVK